MNSVIRRTASRLVASTPNYLEVTCLILVVGAARLLSKGAILNAEWKLCAGIILAVLALLYACLGKGQLFQYLGWTRPRKAVYWLYALAGGVGGAAVAILAVSYYGNGLGQAPASTLFYGVTLGPVIEEMFYRGVAFSVIFVVACSFKVTGVWRVLLPILGTAAFFAGSHQTDGLLPFLIIFGMGLAYGLMRWRSHSTATSAVMHAVYNLTIAGAMILR